MKRNFSVALIRGKYANNYELQGFGPLVKNVKINVFTSRFPIDIPTGIPSSSLFSIADLPIPSTVTRYIANRTLGDMHLLFGLEKMLADYSLLHTADPYYYFSYQAARIKEQHPEKVLVSTVWETIPHNNEKTAAKRTIKQFVSRMTDLFITYSKRSRDMLITEGVPSEKIKLIPLGIDTDRFLPSTRERKKILFVGRFVPEKDPMILLRSFVRFHLTHPEYTLQLAGDGPLREDINRFVDENGMRPFVSIGRFSYAQMPDVYRGSSILVTPSHSSATWEEQYGMVLLEAMASGLPIVATDSGAIPEVVGPAGIIVKQHDENSLSDALDRLSGDAKLRAKLGTIARERAVSRYDRNRFAESILNTYEKILSRHSG